MTTISIITATNNSAKTIKKNLESVTGQEYSKIEQIIIDNCSADNTLDIIKDHYKDKTNSTVRIISEKDRGIADAFNKGILYSSGEVITILNSDDYYYHRKVLSNVALVLKDSNVDFVHGDIFFIDPLYGSNIRKPLLCSLNYAMPFNHTAFFATRTLIDKIGYFNIQYSSAMDFELMCRMYSSPSKCFYEGHYLSDHPMVVMHAGGVSWKNELNAIGEMRKALKKHNFWGPKAYIYQSLRLIRIYLKNKFQKFGLLFIVRLWRKYKWK